MAALIDANRRKPNIWNGGKLEIEEVMVAFALERPTQINRIYEHFRKTILQEDLPLDRRAAT